MTASNETIDLLTAIVDTIESSDEKAQQAKSELLEQLKLLTSKTDVVSTNFPKLIETLSTFDNKIASSFSNIENNDKRLSTVTNQIKSIENSVLNTQQQSKNLQLDHIIEKLSNADQQAQQLSNHLRNSSTKYLENMNAATNIARKKIEELETEVANIADSFSKIVSTRIADNVVTDVSSRLKNHVFRETVTGIEIGANEVAQTLTNKAFKNIDSTLKHTEKTILNDLHSFKKESDTTHQKTTSRSNSNNERNTRNAHATRTGLSKACQQRKSRCKEKLDCNFPYCLVRLYWNSIVYCLCSKKCI